jgi:hypothetical protein
MKKGFLIFFKACSFWRGAILRAIKKQSCDKIEEVKRVQILWPAGMCFFPPPYWYRVFTSLETGYQSGKKEYSEEKKDPTRRPFEGKSIFQKDAAPGIFLISVPDSFLHNI